jgi:hypothetical protein
VCGNVIRGRMVGVRCIAPQINRETKSSHENFFRKKVSCYESPPGGFSPVARFRFRFRILGGSNRGLRRLGVVVQFSFLAVFDRFRYRKGESPPSSPELV